MADELEELRHGLLNISLKWGEGYDRNGQLYGWLVDCRELLLQGSYLEQACRHLWAKLKAYSPAVVGGLTLAANPLTIGLLYESRRDGHPVDGLLIRREPKVDGLRRQVEGPVPTAGTRVVIVDDILNSGHTQHQALNALKPFGCQIPAVGVLIDYQLGGSKWLKDQGIAVESLFTLADLGVALRPPVQPDLVQPLWTFSPLNADDYLCPKSRLWAQDDLLVVGSDRGFVQALSPDGQPRWRFDVRDQQRGVHSSPLVHRGRVYFGAYDGYLYCLDASTGALVWETRPGQWIGSSPAVHPDLDLVYIGLEFGEKGGSLLAVEAGSGQRRWEARVGDYMHASPYLDLPRQQVIVGANDSVVRALDAATGNPRWTFACQGPIKGQVVVDEAGLCFVCSHDGSLYALSADSGELVWRRRLSAQLYCWPLLCRDMVIVGGTSGRLIALERSSGTVRWAATAGGGLVGGAGLVGDCVVVGALDGSISLFSPDRGERLWTFKAQGRILGRPGVGGRCFYVSSGDGSLHAFRLGGS